MNNPLKDQEFLKKLYYHHNKKIQIKIIALNQLEQPVEELQGRATSGSISIDGASAIRRTCSLSLVAENVNITDYLWTLNTSFKVYIGLENNIDLNKYDDIIWFPQGVFVITSFSTSVNTNSFTINISGKDKMCKLNGECGGTIQSAMTLDVVEEAPDSNGNVAVTQIPIHEIIFNLVNQIGKELTHNIIIEDLEQNSYSLLEYQGADNLYLIKNSRGEIVNLTLEGTTRCWLATIDENELIYWSEADLSTIPYYDATTNLASITASQIYFPEDTDTISTTSSVEEVELYTVIKISSGQPLGYEKNDELYYPGKKSLTANAGDSITSVLDKIKQVLGEYEYFYDLEGRFIFREKHNYLQSSWSPIVIEEDGSLNSGNFYINPLITSQYSFSFEGSELVASISNSPKLDNIKNDFNVWGTRDGADSSKIPIHFRCAIDKKPEYYCSPWFYNNNGVTQQEFVTQKYTGAKGDNAIVTDWREIIYQMAVDYTQNHSAVDFLYKIRTAGYNQLYYPKGLTGYEQYYIDMQGFWRQLYNPFYENSNREKNNNLYQKFKTKDYFIEAGSQLQNWNKNVLNNPETLNFWFDFFEFSENQELGKYNVANIGIRSKVTNNNSAKSIYYRDTPGLILNVGGNNPSTLGQYDPINGWIQLQITKSFRDQYLTVSSQGKSCSDIIAELLQQHTNAGENITISCIPIYTLEPNTRILINNNDVQLNGEYTVDKITVPLSYNGTMSINGKKIIQNIS